MAERNILMRITIRTRPPKRNLGLRSALDFPLGLGPIEPHRVRARKLLPCSEAASLKVTRESPETVTASY